MSVTCGRCDARPSEPQGIIKKTYDGQSLVESPSMTSSQETERVYSYNPGACTGAGEPLCLCNGYCKEGSEGNLWLPSETQGITDQWLVLNYAAW